MITYANSNHRIVPIVPRPSIALLSHRKPRQRVISSTKGPVWTEGHGIQGHKWQQYESHTLIQPEQSIKSTAHTMLVYNHEVYSDYSSIYKAV